VEQVLQTTHTICAQNLQLQQAQQEMQLRLQELIEHRTPSDNHTFDVGNSNLLNSTKLTAPSPAATASKAGSGIVSLHEKSDAASVRSTATTLSMRSIRSVVPSFQEALKNSRAYKRVRRGGLESDSIFSVESSQKACSWSMFSAMSLGELSISEISVLELPICLSDLWDAGPYRVDSTQAAVTRRRSFRRSTWSSKGRIHNAIASGNEVVVRTLLALGSDIEERASEGKTPLAHAILDNQDAIVKLLLEKGADMEVRDDQNRTPLAHAVLHNREAIIALLLEKGAKIEVLPALGSTINVEGRLHNAIESGSANVVRLLLAMGADVAERDGEGKTPLAHAVLRDREAIVKLLLEKGANSEDSTALGSTKKTNGRLQSAIDSGNENVVRSLLALGADLEERMGNFNMTSLLFAAYKGKLAIVKILLEKGADVNARDMIEWSVLHWAAYKGDPGVLQILLDNGALHLIDVTAKSREPGDTPLHAAAKLNMIAVAQMLVERGARVNPKNDKGMTPYQVAQRWNSPAVAKYLWSQRSPDEQAAEASPYD
jgi:ankyrin repeat protein